jgi:hypothetical protein
LKDFGWRPLSQASTTAVCSNQFLETMSIVIGQSLSWKDEKNSSSLDFNLQGNIVRNLQLKGYGSTDDEAAVTSIVYGVGRAVMGQWAKDTHRNLEVATKQVTWTVTACSGRHLHNLKPVNVLSLPWFYVELNAALASQALECKASLCSPTISFEDPAFAVKPTVLTHVMAGKQLYLLDTFLFHGFTEAFHCPGCKGSLERMALASHQHLCAGWEGVILTCT